MSEDGTGIKPASDLHRRAPRVETNLGSTTCAQRLLDRRALQARCSAATCTVRLSPRLLQP